MNRIEKLEEKTDQPVILVNHEGIITHVNGAFEKAFKWQREKLIGMALTTVIPANLRDAHNLGFSRFLVTARPTLLDQDLDLKIRTGDGKTVTAGHFITAGETGGKWCFGAVIKPQTKNNEQD